MSNPFDRNPFRLPPPWNAGYALPQNVDDEGLERHTYTTAWAPRGSFDNPKVGTAGYAVPQYVKDEGYGVGAMVTRWAQRGTYAGPKVVHWLDKPPPRIVGAKAMPGGGAQIELQTMSGVEMKSTGQAKFTSYGLSSARSLLSAVKMMPSDMRVRQLQKALDKIDPKLYSQAKSAADKEAKSGVPADVALERGLAVAMSYGLANEVVGLGRGKKPAKRSQLGAVCLGDTPTAGQCTADGKMIWDAGGFWRRLNVGEVCGGAGTAVVNVRTGGGTVVAPATPVDQKFVHVGPFLIPLGTARWTDNRGLSAEQKAFINDQLKQLAMQVAQGRTGGFPATSIYNGVKAGTYPIVKFDMSGSQWGLYVGQDSSGGAIVTFKKFEPGGGLFGAVWDVISKVVAAIVDFVEDAASFIKDKACDLFTGPAGQVAGAAAGAVVGGAAGAQAGAIGAQVAAQACSSPPAPGVAAPVQPESSSMLPALLIGGIGIAAVLLLGKK